MEVTLRFTLNHATVHFPDGRTENIEYVNKEDYGELIHVYDFGEDSFEVFVGRNDGLHLRLRNRKQRYQTIYSTANVEKIENDWQEEYVAVVEVDEEAFTQRESKWFGLREETHLEKPDDYQMPEVEIWHAVEYDAHRQS